MRKVDPEEVNCDKLWSEGAGSREAGDSMFGVRKVGSEEVDCEEARPEGAARRRAGY